ncbi:MAG: DMT family transporter [Elusimicrobiaceae bacterium]|nr:DMT family transporter [Elusimicrobiaceae bacterium]
MQNTSGNPHGPALALTAAALFGVSPVLIKPVVGESSPVLAAGLLYLGAAAGLSFIALKKPNRIIRAVAQLPADKKLALACAVISGGILAPLCLVWGIKLASAFEVSLWLNLETVATTVLAWLVFKEHVSREVWLGMLLLAAGAALLGFGPADGQGFSAAGLLIALACLLWGLDSNLTRELDSLPAPELVWLKSAAAGTANVMLAFSLGTARATAGQTAALMGIGAMSYGASLLLYIHALRRIGTSRTGAYFSAGPFFGLIFAVVFLGERPAAAQWLAAGIMAGGLTLLYRERHLHRHRHEPVTHTHHHAHDDCHHAHTHHDITPSKGHTHSHTHEPLTHTHPHYPDTHHRHAH